MSRLNTVNIRPGVNVLSVLPHLNYKAWYALAEFVDNSIQSSISRRKDLEAASGGSYVLRVDITFDADDSRIVIFDNAAGIASSDYQRAFRPAEIPPDATGLSEFGMGMKSAACWFAPKWSVRSSALGERDERTVFFDIERIVHDSIEELNVVTSVASEDKHYTEIRLEDIRRFPKGRTIGKIKEHLASIYRIFLRSGALELCVDGERLTFEEPKILVAPYFEEPYKPTGPKISWRREIDIDLGPGKSATGFVAIREKADTRLAGLALFRRQRLVFGSADEPYRPPDIFKRSNSYESQRVFGEIHLKGFNVSHTKDGVQWGEAEDEFLKKLHKILRSDDLPIIRQTNNYRALDDARNARKVARSAAPAVAKQFDHRALIASQPAFPSVVSPSPEPSPDENLPDVGEQLDAVAEGERDDFQFEFLFRGTPWIVKLELSYADRESDWLSIQSRPAITDPDPREVLIRVAMLHPFMAQFPNLDSEGFAAVLNIAATMALSEVIATELASHHPKAIRQYTNEILKNLVTRAVPDE
ncbi:ATP-binding protein [Jannaschia sp. M317]|uniref:ATP-binding protein n=1 Tax=Jannaschia sp. M317 TaxID=2867011 RepID=UPI0021A62521|nr:ATP-binding protein [Jannaschia sp. M317]UWQ16684.1 ATP-binding protein [Jannaschia sp. M317]